MNIVKCTIFSNFGNFFTEKDAFSEKSCNNKKLLKLGQEDDYIFFSGKPKIFQNFPEEFVKIFLAIFRKNTLEILIQWVKIRQKNFGVAVELYRLRKPFRNTHTLHSRKALK